MKDLEDCDHNDENIYDNEYSQDFNDFEEDAGNEISLRPVFFDATISQNRSSRMKRNAIQNVIPASCANIISGDPVYIRKKLYYRAHASTIYSVEQALTIVDYIGKKFSSDLFLPYALSLIENGQPVSIHEDNGEFACGNDFS
jgi:hypothetical protein